MTRRQVIAGAWASAVLPVAGYAQPTPDYPTKPVRVIVGQAPGGGNDIQTRLFAQKLTETLGKPFVVENRTGAGGVVAFRAVASASPDGYTLLGASGGFTVAPAVHRNLGFDPLNDLAPVSLVVRAPFLLMVHPTLPVKDVKELLALARAKPGMLAYGSAGHGSSTHLAFALLSTLSRIDVIHVPYKGTGPALADAMSGQVQMLMGNVLSSLQHVKTRRLRALAVSTDKRSLAMPELPTIAEAGVPGYEASTWHAWFATAGTPAAISERLSMELARASRATDVIARLAPDGAEPVGSSPEHLRQFIGADIARWRKVVKQAGITFE